MYVLLTFDPSDLLPTLSLSPYTNQLSVIAIEKRLVVNVYAVYNQIQQNRAKTGGGTRKKTV